MQNNDIIETTLANKVLDTGPTCIAQSEIYQINQANQAKTYFIETLNTYKSDQNKNLQKYLKEITFFYFLLKSIFFICLFFFFFFFFFNF